MRPHFATFSLLIALAAPALSAPSLTPFERQRAIDEVLALETAYERSVTSAGPDAPWRALDRAGDARLAALEARLEAAKAVPIVGEPVPRDAKECGEAWPGALARAAISNATTVVSQNDAAYDTSRAFTQAVNAMYSYRKPVAVVYVGSEADVAAVLTAAAAAHCPVCPRAGGHDTSGASSCTGGILVDVTRLNTVDTSSPDTVTVGAGVRFAQLIPALAAVGRGAVTGSCPDVGLTGYSLGGGWGILSKRYGFGADNVVAYRVVLANGTRVVANATSHADLFWGLRGGGHGNFGVVTSIVYKTFPVSKFVVANAEFKLPQQRDQAIDALVLWGSSYLNKPPRTLSTNPHFGPAAGSGDLVLSINTVNSDAGPTAEADTRAYLEPFKQLGATIDVTPNVPFTKLDDFEKNIAPPAVSDNYTGPPVWEYKLGAIVNRTLNRDEWAAIVDGMMAVPPTDKGVAPYIYAYLEPYEGAMVEDVAKNETAFVHRSPGFDIVYDVFSYPATPGSSAAALAWLRKLYFEKWAPLASGETYQNYPSAFLIDPPAVALRSMYGDAVCRLAAVKRAYDPSDVFKSKFGVGAAQGC